MTYHEYLNSIEWQRTRKHKLEEAHGRCQLCDCGAGVCVHHRTYDRLFNERLDDLIVLCQSCHDRFHDKLPPTPTTVEEPRRNMTLSDAQRILEQRRKSA